MPTLRLPAHASLGNIVARPDKVFSADEPDFDFLSGDEVTDNAFAELGNASNLKGAIRLQQANRRRWARSTA
jgi:hypothetical protein